VSTNAPAQQQQAPNDPIGPETIIFEGAPALVPSLGALLVAIFTVGLALIWFWFQRGGTTYKITNQRVVIDSGLFSKKLDQLDLYRVNDFVVDRPFGQRLLGTGNIRMTTFDKSSPTVELLALKTDVVALYEVLRRAVEAAKQAKGVRIVDYE
jgi:uncharacterized membrane protein YdbT with pleckstrin-like domain